MTNAFTYKDAGVDIDAGDRLVQEIRPFVRKTFRKEVLSDIGLFGGLVAVDTGRFPDPVLVASTDGVGTKLRIAFEMDRHDTVGQDLVAMCVNDVIVHGAEPLLFLDYFGTGRLLTQQATEVIKGIADGCRMAGCALIGGETAEMPSFYPGGEYDLAGFCVGVVNRDRIITGQDIRPGDVALGLPSSGLHSNGYSLVRKIYSEQRGYALSTPLEGMSIPLGEELLRPTRIYVSIILRLLERFHLKGIAHITGGGLQENVPRILPSGTGILMDLSSWPVPEIFRHIERDGNVPLSEMLRTFNYGIGMVIVVDQSVAGDVSQFLDQSEEPFFRIGEIVPRQDGEQAVRWVGDRGRI